MKTGKTIKVAIIVDPLGGGGKTEEEEFEQHARWLKKKFGKTVIPYKTCGVDSVSPGTELILFDYGGMLPGTDMPAYNAKALIRWCEDNPSALALVMSSFTWGIIIERELEELGLGCLPNLHNWCEDFTIPLWWLKLKGLENR